MVLRGKGTIYPFFYRVNHMVTLTYNISIKFGEILIYLTSDSLINESLSLVMIPMIFHNP